MKCFSIYIRFLIPIIFLFLCACDKEDPTDPSSSSNSNAAPEITVTSPSGGSSYTLGESISIIASVKDNKEIYELNVTLKNLSNNSITSVFGLHVHQASYNLNTSYMITSSTPAGSYNLIIKATDFDGNSTEKTVAVTIN